LCCRYVFDLVRWSLLYGDQPRCATKQRAATLCSVAKRRGHAQCVTLLTLNKKKKRKRKCMQFYSLRQNRRKSIWRRELRGNSERNEKNEVFT